MKFNITVYLTDGRRIGLPNRPEKPTRYDQPPIPLYRLDPNGSIAAQRSVALIVVDEIAEPSATPAP